MLLAEPVRGRSFRGLTSSATLPDLANKTFDRLHSVPCPQKKRGKVKMTHFDKKPAEKAKTRAHVVAQRTDPPRFKGQTNLERLAVSEAVARDYTRRIEDLRRFSKMQKLPLKGPKKLDEACTRYLNDIFEQGVEFHEGSKFVAAVKDAFPDYGPKGMLPRMVRALQGWGKVDPQKTRPPLPWELVASIAMKMRKRGRMHPALATLTMFTAYLRPGECLAIHKVDLVKPMPKQEFHTLHLHPAERHEASKVGISEESIQLDAMQVPWLGLALDRLQTPGPFLFDLGYTEMVSAWKQALVDVGLEHNHAVLHQLRHSGPSFDRCHRLRSLMEIKARGRWAADASLRRYEQHGRLNQEYHRLPQATQKLVLQLEEQMRKLGPKFFTLP